MLYYTAIIILIIDQITKYFVESRLYMQSVPIIPGIFHLTYVENTGAAFGMLENNNIFFIILCLAIVAVIFYLIYKYKPQQKIVKLSIGLLIGGAAGNIADRLIRGYVVDFFDLRFIKFPVFNVADCAIVVGAVLFALAVLFDKDDSNAKV